MKRTFPSLCFAAVFAVGLSAQTPAQTPQNPTTNPAPSSMAGQKNTVTLTGCVKAGEEPNTFVLSNIKTDADHATGTSGSTAAAAMPDLKGQEVRLIGAPASVDLSKHVGHTVSVSGMMAPQAGMTPRGTTGAPSTTTPSTNPPSTTEPANPSAARPSMDMNKAAHSFNVSSLSMVSATCSM
jgi:hypothetical protein